MLSDINKDRKINFFLYIIFIISIFIAGGYFEYVSCLVAIPLMVFALVIFFKNNKVIIPKNFNFLAICVVVLFYLISSLWAIDSGMAIFGFVKFLPVIFYFILVNSVEDKGSWIVSMLPITGVLMTIFSFVMSLFNSFERYVTVAGRLSGSFQYPNTFAIFLLVCIVLAAWENDKKNIFYIAVLMFGIYKSGSRTVYILTVVVALLFLIINKKTRKITAFILLAIFVAVAAMFFFGVDNRITSISLKSSTFVGRMLYYKDAIPVILKHPFGLGYYGYYFVEQEIQTGLYSVVNVHNEVLQLLLDVGFIPTIIFFGALVKCLVSKNMPVANKVAVGVLIAHSLLDYDFQFISILFVLIMLLPKGEVKSEKITMFSKAIMAMVGAGVLALAVIFGLSNFYYTRGENELSYKICKSNTVAELGYLYDIEDDVNLLRATAEDLISRNKHLPSAYGVIAAVKLSEGDVKSFIELKNKVLDMAPYQFEEYLDYMDSLNLCVEKYLQAGDRESAKICYEEMKNIPERLYRLVDKTSDLAWEIDDIPSVNLPVEYLDILEEAGKLFNE